MTRSVLRYVPNTISIARLACFPILVGLAYFGDQQTYAWLLVGAFISDAVDGFIARTADVTSKSGALLDSIADLSIQLAAVYGIWVFYESFVRANATIFVIIIGLWACDMVFSYWRYGRVASFHTYTSRIAAYVLAIFLAVLFLWGVQPWLFYLAVAMIVLSLLEGLVLIAKVPAWRSDVRGLYWVLKNENGDA